MKKYIQNIQGDYDHLKKMREVAQKIHDAGKDTVQSDYMLKLIDDWMEELEPFVKTK